MLTTPQHDKYPGYWLFWCRLYKHIYCLSSSCKMWVIWSPNRLRFSIEVQHRICFIFNVKIVKMIVSQSQNDSSSSLKSSKAADYPGSHTVLTADSFSLNEGQSALFVVKPHGYTHTRASMAVCVRGERKGYHIQAQNNNNHSPFQHVNIYQFSTQLSKIWLDKNTKFLL